MATLLAVTILGERLPALSWCGLGVLAAGPGLPHSPGELPPARDREREHENDGPIRELTR